MCSSPEAGILVPIPQYPLYTATLSVLGAQCVPYYLDESKGWGTDLDTIREAYKKAKDAGTNVRAIVIINPGNPTGASLDPEDVRSVLEFAADNKLVVMADEVYQTNIFQGKFYSFKKGLRELQKSDKNKDGKFDSIELASLHSISKGMVGECGHRGGYFEMVGFDKEVVEQIYKFVSIMLCPPVIGQCIVEMMCNPPKEGDESYELYKKEYDGIFNGLQDRATALYEAFKQMEGVECQSPAGSMYLFPTISLPEKAQEAAKKENKSPDEYYCFRLLDATGICVVAGSGFGQREGTLHFRTTFLAPGTDWVGRMTKFHKEFMEEFR
ncbi:hypothetical protein LTS18_012209 [Coniosporium uncinatum]|uniref:Uncharacterized protein n=2 Tax=Coniosporium uncinatum TaxID=93489 RepID=A0ACC3CXY3_9PEZI|nr:hypothetical protein LTS18_012209 [Coniosporium uncinatum]